MKSEELDELLKDGPDAEHDDWVIALYEAALQLRTERDEALRILSGVMGGENRAVDAAVKLLNQNKEIVW
jgi:hypothetical protein